MELICESSALISNYEVYNLLLDVQAGRNGQSKPTKNQTHLATVTYETIKYLEKTMCKYQNSDAIKSFIAHLAPFNLTKAEKLQLLNQRPTTAVEIQLLIEESEERLTENQVYQLLEVVAKYLPDGSPDVSVESDDKAAVYGDEEFEEEEEEEEEEEMEEGNEEFENDDPSLETEDVPLVTEISSPVKEDSS